MRTRYNGVEQGGAVTPEAVGDAWGDWVSGEGVAAGVADTLDASRVSTVDLSAATYEAGSVSGGASAGQLELSTSAQDLVSGISLTVGAAQLQYEARALASDGTGTDVHNVTYTLVDA